MRHARKINTLSRTSSHRKALMSNMANALFRHKRIHTTVAKAKALRKYVEPLITRAKEDTRHSRRMVFSYLQDKYIMSELYGVITAKVGERPGGYTRIIRLHRRKGDAAELCMIELVDFNTWMTTTQGKPAPKTRRRRGSSTKASAENALAATSTAAATDTDVAQSAASQPTEKPPTAPDASKDETSSDTSKEE